MLGGGCGGGVVSLPLNSQADDAPEDDDIKVENVRNANRKAQQQANHARPAETQVSASSILFV